MVNGTGIEVKRMAKKSGRDQFFRECHDRWMKLRNRRQEEPGYKDDWHAEQCLFCEFFIPLSGVLAEDYGACSNAVSKWDAHVRFEHDGCEHFSADEEKVI